MEDSELVQGPLGVSRVYTLNGMPMPHGSAHFHTWGSSPPGMVFGRLEKSYLDMPKKKTHGDSKLNPDSNPELWRHEAATILLILKI